MTEGNSLAPLEKHRVPVRSLSSNIIAMLTGSVAGQMIAIFAAPLLTRVYSPREFAGLALIVAAANLLSVLTTLRYEHGVVLAKGDRAAAILSALSLTLIITVSGVLSATVFLTAGGQGLLPRFPLDTSLLTILPLHVFLLGFYSLCVRFHMRKCSFRLIATTELIASAITLSTQVAVGLFLGPSAVLLVACVVAGRTVGAIFLGCELVRFVTRHRRSVGRQTLMTVAKRYWRFPMFTTFAELAGQSTTEAPKFMLGAFFPVQALGMFALCTRVLEKPVSLANSSVQQVFYKFVVDNRHQPRKTQVYLFRVTSYLGAIIAIPAVVLLLWAEPMFEFAFGSAWREAGQYARLLIPMLVARFTILPTCWAMVALEKQHAQLLWNLFHLVQAVVALTIGGWSGDPRLAVLFFSWSSAVMYGVLFLINLHYIKHASTKSQRIATPLRNVRAA